MSKNEEKDVTLRKNYILLGMEFPQILDYSDEFSEKGVFLNFEDVNFDIPNPDYLCSWLSSIPELEKKPLAVVNYIFCSDEYLLQVNREYLQHDYYTDVITFPYSESLVEGDVFISIDRVKDNAHSIRSDFYRELYRVMAHGILHLMGYLDKSPDEKEKMTEKEDHYLQLYNL